MDKIDTWFYEADFETLEKMGFKMFGFDEEETQKRVDEVNAWWKELSREEKKEWYDKFN